MHNTYIYICVFVRIHRHAYTCIYIYREKEIVPRKGSYRLLVPHLREINPKP